MNKEENEVDLKSIKKERNRKRYMRLYARNATVGKPKKVKTTFPVALGPIDPTLPASANRRFSFDQLKKMFRLEHWMMGAPAAADEVGGKPKKQPHLSHQGKQECARRAKYDES